MKNKLLPILLIPLVFSSNSVRTYAEEPDQKIVELCTISINDFYTQESDSPAVVYQEQNGNQYLKLAYKNSDYSSFYFDSKLCINDNGVYKIEADIRYNQNLKTDNISMDIFSEYGLINKTLATSVDELNQVVEDSSNPGWKKFTVHFIIDDFHQKFYECFKFGYNTLGNKQNYIDIDNISISKLETDFEQVLPDKDENGSFEQIEENYLFDKPGWHHNMTYYVEKKLENSIVKDEEQNKLKLYTSKTDHTDFTKSLDLSINEPGWYQLSFKAKGGKDFKTNNLGYRIIGSEGTILKDTNINYSKIGTKKYTEVTSIFRIEEAHNSSWVNLSLWLFTHNNKTKSEENYLLIDEIKISKKVSENKYSDNLFENGKIINFVSEQGQKFYDTKYGDVIKDYPYCKDIISKGFLEKYSEGTKFLENSKEQDYWGTLDYDVPAEIVKVNNQNAVLLSYDGMQQKKTYASFAYLLDLVEMSTKKYYALEFDYKLTNEDSDTVTVAFIGSENKPDFEIDLLTAQVGDNYTKGYNRNVYTYEIIEKEDNWKTCRLVFKPDMEFKERVTALRFLMNANYNVNNSLLLTNISLVEYSNIPYVSNEVAPKKDNNLPIYIGIGVGVAVILGIVITVVVTKKRGEE